MDFQENKQTEVSTDNTQSVENNNAPSEQNEPSYENNSGPLLQNEQPYENNNGSPYPNGQPYGNNSGSPYPNGQPYENNSGSPYQNRQPYGNNNGTPYQSTQPYGSNGAPYQSMPPYGNGTPYPAPQQPYENNKNANVSAQNGNSYRNNTPYGNQYPNGNGYQGSYHSNTNNYNSNNYNPNNGYNNQYPYYGRNAYQIPAAEPGSNLAKAAMICGILSIIFCFTFTVYPAFVLGSVAVILALLSKGRRNKLFSQARTGIICAAIGLIINAVILTSSLVYVFTNPEGREEFNRQWERIYGEPFDDMMEDRMENNDYHD